MVYSRPDGTSPLLGDADDGRALPFGDQPMGDHRYLVGLIGSHWHVADLIQGFSGSRAEVTWTLGPRAAASLNAAASLTDEGQRAPIPSAAFPQAGVFVMRNAHDHVFIECDGVGMAGRGGHGHNDCLSFEAALAGVHVITDCGAYVYTANAAERNRFRSTAFHNTPQIDGHELNRFVGWNQLWALHDDAVPEVHEWKVGSDRDVFVGSHTGYERLDHPINPVRTIVLDHHAHAVTVTDEIRGEGEHRISIPLHLAAGVDAKRVGTTQIVLTSGTSAFLLEWSSREEWDAAIEPARVSPSYGVTVPALRIVVATIRSVSRDVDGACRAPGAPIMSLLMVINTAGLQFDDRLRKEVLSLKNLGHDVTILGLEYANRAGRTTVYDGVPATTIRLRSRGWFKRGCGVVVKTLEMYMWFLAGIVRTRPDIVWCHNLELGGLVPVLAILRACRLVRHIIWDQHELPADSLMRRRAFKALYVWLAARCDRIVMANGERRDLVTSWSGGAVGKRVEVLENLPDAQFAALPVRPLPPDVSRWLDGSPYFLAQGGANPDRHLDSLVTAVLSDGLPKLIVVGPYSERQLADLETVHGPGFKTRVLFTGAVPQMELTPFIDHAVASIVLYEMNSQNTRLCAPNRMYQALSRAYRSSWGRTRRWLASCTRPIVESCCRPTAWTLTTCVRDSSDPRLAGMSFKPPPAHVVPWHGNHSLQQSIVWPPSM